MLPFSSGFKYVRVSLGMLGKFAATLYFNAFYVWSAELAATVVRYVSGLLAYYLNVIRNCFPGKSCIFMFICMLGDYYVS